MFSHHSHTKKKKLQESNNTVLQNKKIKMKELNSTPSKRDKKTFLIHQFLFIILLATSYPTSVFSQTYRKIAGWSDEVNNRIINRN